MGDEQENATSEDIHVPQCGAAGSNNFRQEYDGRAKKCTPGGPNFLTADAQSPCHWIQFERGLSLLGDVH